LRQHDRFSQCGLLIQVGKYLGDDQGVFSASASCVALPPASLQSYETFPLACPVWGRRSASSPLTHRDVLMPREAGRWERPSPKPPLAHQILDHIGEPHQPPHIHRPRGPPDWLDADEQVFLDEDLDRDRYQIDKSSGQKICTAEGCPYGSRTGTCAMNSINGRPGSDPTDGTDAEWFHRTAEHLSCRLQGFIAIPSLRCDSGSFRKPFTDPNPAILCTDDSYPPPYLRL
jgi:hypothetical protein